MPPQPQPSASVDIDGDLVGLLLKFCGQHRVSPVLFIEDAVRTALASCLESQSVLDGVRNDCALDH